MADGHEMHKTSTYVISEASGAEIDAGSDVTFKVWVSCSGECDLRGHTVRLATHDDSLTRELEITEFDGIDNETAECVVRAPLEPGVYAWRVIFPEQGRGGIAHAEDAEPFPFVVKPHRISLAVWDLPSPVVVATPLRFRVGATCVAHCSLVGKEVEVLDAEGAPVGRATLGSEPLPGAAALYWADVTVEAPQAEGLHKWSARMSAPDLAYEHDEAVYPFVFRTIGPPDHVVTVEVVDLQDGGPVEQADVLMHPYRARTGAGGEVRLEVCRGEYVLRVTKGNIGAYETTVVVEGDMSIQVKVLDIPPIRPDGSP